ncbi:putative baseplate assembly protein [Pseudogemmobacter bohemicus]|uniref:putative baseplate assembly protein n=1 Tax=Pseudogemmobacter bohemicus TaxID=2250708 RepID=UPI000DD2EBCA|nr:putative baseplate assembly protein [Pseudogemmobacter bohemicus]
MTGARYDCCDPGRRAALQIGGPAGLSGIDYIELRQGNPVSLPTEIDIHLVRPLPLPAAALTKANIRVTGGVRYPAPAIADVIAEPGPDEVSQYRVIFVPGLTDFSTYRLELVASGGNGVPGFIDPRLAAVDFTFKIDCPSDFDCAEEPPLPRNTGAEVPFDLMARDWASLRRLMLDRMAVLVPGFREDDPADLTVTLIEALASRFDQQSYSADWIGTEALPDSARTRAAMVAHARLLDYQPGEGASAVTFIAVEYRPVSPLAEGALLPRSTPLLAGSGEGPLCSPEEYARIAVTGDLTVFETMRALKLWSWRNEIRFHTWSDGLCMLPRGAVSATLVDGSGGQGGLKPGDDLVLVQTRAPDTGAAADADPALRHAVRLTAVSAVSDPLAPAGTNLVQVTWSEADALPFDLVIEADIAQVSGPDLRLTCALVLGNVTAADHGQSLPPPAMLGPAVTGAGLSPRPDPPSPPDGLPWRPVLRNVPGPVARCLPEDNSESAAGLIPSDPALCVAQLSLDDGFTSWQARDDLLASGPYDRDFVLEETPAGLPQIRFGDGVLGLRPGTGLRFSPAGRFGLGRAGMIGPGALGRAVVRDSSLGIARIWNPLPAQGGAGPESLAQIRIAAPEAFRRQERAVSAADYAAAAMRFPGVANAVAVPRWTGAWQTMLIHIDREGGLAVDAGFRDALLVHLDHFRLAGFDVAIRNARTIPLDIALTICAAPGHLRSAVARAVRRSLSPFGPADGAPGFFHPDNFTFGSVLYLSRLIAAVLAVPGVQSVVPLTFQRFGRAPDGEIAAGVIRPGGTGILELADDPNFPERGRLTLMMGGGR